MSTSSKTAPPNSTQVKLRPREHGAYSILGMPLLAGLLIGGVTPIGVLTTIAAVAGFLANEPLLVVWGNRGQRAKQSGTAATRTLIGSLVTAIVCGGVALFLGSIPVQITLLFSLLLAVLGMVLSVMGHQRTLTAQIVGILGLTM
ncbi:MAG: YwiC-like family protein, partial [Planctomycetaceae bacterium]|nr:YwiC-like family protein [Planctomycetaceae bacterium]